MSRKFTWNDLPTLPRYRKRQIFLNSVLGYTYAPGVMSSVLQSFMTPGLCISVHPDGLIGLVGHSSHKSSARLAFVAARDSFSNPAVVDLVTHLCQQAGEMGAFRVLAEVEADTSLAGNLLRVGFLPYAEQRMWRLPSRLSTSPPADVAGAWRPVSARNLGGIHSLYQKLVPAEVRRVEPPPTAADLQGLVCLEEETLVGYAAAQFGPRGSLLEVWLDHAQDDHQSHLTAIRAALVTHRSQTIYLRVRAYQQRLGSAAESLGASPISTQTCMVKQLAAHQKNHQAFKLPAIERQPDVSTPIVNSETNS